MPLLIAISKYSILLFLCQGNNHLFNDIFLYYIGKYEQKLLVLLTKRLGKCISSKEENKCTMRIQVHRDSNTAVEKVSNTTTHVAL